MNKLPEDFIEKLKSVTLKRPATVKIYRTIVISIFIIKYWV